MAATVPTIEPYELIAGDTLKFNKTVVDYTPGDGWALDYSFRSDTGTGFDIAGTGNSSAGYFEVNVTAATTTNYTAGTYAWQAYSSKSSERFLIDSGKLVIKANLNALATSATTDQRTHARVMVETIRGILEGRASSDMESYNIGGRSINKIPIQELADLLQRYEDKLKLEEAKRQTENKHGTGRLVKARF